MAHNNLLFYKTSTILIIICILFLQVFYTAAEEISMMPSQTSAEKIDFFDIPWLIDATQFKQLLIDANIPLKATTEEIGVGYGIYSESSSFGDGNIIPVAYSDHVRVGTHIFENNDYRNSCKIGGHRVGKLIAEFYYEHNDNKSEGKLYSIAANIIPHSQITSLEQYDDLKEKLTTLYGIPYTYNETLDGVIFDFEYDFCIWLGADHTAVYIEKIRSSNDSLNDGDITLYYGLTSSFEAFNRIEAAQYAKENQQKESSIRDIQNSYSGL